MWKFVEHGVTMVNKLAVVLVMLSPTCMAQEPVCEKFVYEIIHTNPYYIWVNGEKHTERVEQIVVCRETDSSSKDTVTCVSAIALNNMGSPRRRD